jgi:hypothetical protein
MKKLLFILIVLGTMSCNITQLYEPKFTLGMEETEFKNINRYATKVYGDQAGVVIYRTYNQYTESYKFFMFDKQKLVKFQEGTYKDDYRFL